MCRSTRMDERARLERADVPEYQVRTLPMEGGTSSNTSVIGCAGDLPLESIY